MDMTDLSLKLETTSKKIISYLDKKLTGQVEELWEASRHYVFAGGKGIRPFIVENSFALFNDAPDLVIPFGAAIEVLHNFTLVHDDIIDGDDMRRSVPTVHMKWNEPVAIIAGDLLMAMAVVMTGEQAPVPFSGDVVSMISLELGRVCASLCEGQTLDFLNEKRTDVTVEEYLTMASLKTGSLFSSCARIGGLAAGAGKDELKALCSYGKNLGFAFQLQDDILGIAGSSKDLGKPVHNDLYSGKMTYIIIMTRKALPDKARRGLDSIMLEPDKKTSDIGKLLGMIKDTGSLDKARTLAAGYSDDASRALDIFPDSEPRQNLIAIARMAVDRIK